MQPFIVYHFYITIIELLIHAGGLGVMEGIDGAVNEIVFFVNGTKVQNYSLWVSVM